MSQTADVPTPSHAERARTLVTGRRTGALATLAIEPAGHPYGSLVAYALAGDEPVLLISRLAEHTRNLERDPRASLLVTAGDERDPLAEGRVTLLGRCQRIEAPPERETARSAFLAAHPSAATYVDFADFGLWRLGIEALRWIGGFGRMSWVSREQWLVAEADPLAPHAATILEHMNSDHAANLLDYSRAFGEAHDASAVAMSGVDRYGFEMEATTPAGTHTVRIAFRAPVATPGEARHELVRLAREARERLGDVRTGSR